MTIPTVVESRDTLARVFAARFAAAAEAAVARSGRLAVAIPGGSAADVLLPALVDVEVDWDRVHVYWVDERAVGIDDPASNFGLARRLWLSRVPISGANIHRMPADREDLDAAAAAYDAELTRTLGPPADLDLVLLGVGADGHVASLFPGHPALADLRRNVLPILDAPKPPPRRLTLTLPMLSRAHATVVAAFGAEKAATIRAAVHDPASRLPLAMVLREARQAELLLEPDAAAPLS
jgi:6-phosphogluconolactonase